MDQGLGSTDLSQKTAAVQRFNLEHIFTSLYQKKKCFSPPAFTTTSSDRRQLKKNTPEWTRRQFVLILTNATEGRKQPKSNLNKSRRNILPFMEVLYRVKTYNSFNVLWGLTAAMQISWRETNASRASTLFKSLVFSSLMFHCQRAKTVSINPYNSHNCVDKLTKSQSVRSMI